MKRHWVRKDFGGLNEKFSQHLFDIVMLQFAEMIAHYLLAKNKMVNEGSAMEK